MKRWMILILIVVFIRPLAVPAGEQSVGKIAVASDGKTITEPVGFRMGGSSYYLLFDGQGKFLEAIDNPFKDAGGNAAGRSGKSAFDSLRFDEKGGLIGEVETPPKEEREKVWNSLMDFLASKGVTIVVAEQFGYEIIREMRERGITCIEFKGKSVDGAEKVSLSAKKIK